jgi:hypothetical protein
LLTIGGLLITVAHTWTLLLIVVAPVVLVQAAAMFSSESVRRRLRWWVVLPAFSCVALGLLKGMALLLQMLDLSTIVHATGGFTGSSPMPMFVLAIAFLWLALALPSRARRAARATDEDLFVARRIRILGLTPLLGLVSLTVLLVAQLQALGTTAYYFLKYFLGVELVLAGVVPAVITLAVAMLVEPPRRRGATVGLALVAALLASQTMAPFPFGKVGLRAHPGGTASVGTPLAAGRMADGILAAARGSERETSLEQSYVALGPQRAGLAVYPDAWFHAILASGTVASGTRAELLRRHVEDVDDAAAMVEQVLGADESTQVLVAPVYVEGLRRRMPTPDLAARVVGWSVPSS